MSFLRLFPAYRALEAELASCASARILAEDQARYHRAKCEAAEEERRAAQADLQKVLKSAANFEARRAGSIDVPFRDADTTTSDWGIAEPASSQGEQTPRSTRRLARDVQIEKIEQTRRANFELHHATQNHTTETP